MSGFKVSYRGQGKDGTLPYHPALLVKLMLYAYSVGVFSSRQIERKIREDIAFRVLSAENYPSYRTIARFRKENLEAFSELFTQVVRIAAEAGLVNMGFIAVDGSKVHANASKHKAMSYGRMREEENRIEAEIKALVEKAQAADEAEQEEGGVSIPEELSRRQDRLQVIRDAEKRLERRVCAEKLTENSQENFTDPDSRIMKVQGGFEQCYNTQVAVDSESQVIVAAEVTQDANDKRQLVPLVRKVEKETGELPKEVAADSGYCSEQNLENLDNLKVRGYISCAQEGKRANIDKEKFPATGKMACRLRKKRGKQKYAKRKGIVEPVFGWVKSVLGFRQFLLRGLKAVSAEWRLVCAALNLRRLSERIKWAPG